MSNKILPLILLFISWPLMAEDELDLYRVELILFTQSSIQGDDEIWPETDHVPATFEAQQLTTLSSTMPLSEESVEMGSILYTLNKSALYQPLLHTVWAQPGWSADEAQAIRIEIPFDEKLPKKIFSENAPLSSEQAAPTPLWQNLSGVVEASPTETNMLSGTIKISRARYLHAEFDLIFREQVAQPVVSEETLGGVLAESTPAVQYIEIPMQQKRRMRSKERHYIDHPRLGALIEITPIEQDDESDEAVDDPEAGIPESN